MKFDGNNWINVGITGFSAGEAYGTSLAFSPTGNPYVAYGDGTALDKATVMYYNAPAGIRELQSSEISLYPNPATDKITVKTSGITGGGNLAIVNIEGQRLITRQITQPKTQVDISSLPSGVYFVHLISDKTVAVGKLIKE